MVTVGTDTDVGGTFAAVPEVQVGELTDESLDVIRSSL
jgi:hypothetical protein